jgi:hypothetical protein
LETFPDKAPKNPDDETYKQPVYADSAHQSEKIINELQRRDFAPQIIERSYRGKRFTEEQKENNKSKSKIRCRIEHIFESQKMQMGNEILRTIGIIRAKFQIGMRNLVYNICRLITIKQNNKISKFTQKL